MTTQQEMDDAIALAMQTGRTEALVEAELALRAEVPKTKWAADANLIKRMADKIAGLPRRV